MNVNNYFDYVKENHPGTLIFEREVWKPITGLENIPDGKYSISTWGRVYNNVSHKFLNNRIISGYNAVTLIDNNNGKHAMLVHRLMGEAFIPKTNPKANVINHIDGNRLNNVAGNLEWVTNKENTYHSWLLELQQTNAPYISNEQVHMVCKMLEDCKTYAEIQQAIKDSNPKCEYDDDKLRGFISNIKQHRTYLDISSQYNIDNKHRQSIFSDAQIKKLCDLLAYEGTTVTDIFYHIGIDPTLVPSFKCCINDVLARRRFASYTEGRELYRPIGM